MGYDEKGHDAEKNGKKNNKKKTQKNVEKRIKTYENSFPSHPIPSHPVSQFLNNLEKSMFITISSSNCFQINKIISRKKSDFTENHRGN